MKIAVAYVVVTHGPISDQYCARFVSTWKEYPPLVDCDLVVLANGGPLSLELSLILHPLNPIFFPRENDPGHDISAYQSASRGPCADYDAVLCLGESVYFHREGWLKRLVQAWERYGPGMYGPFSSNAVRAHLNTTAFLCTPSLLKNYSQRVHDRLSRYEFEHGIKPLWRRASEQGMPVRLVTWDGEWEPHRWRMPRNILWRGDQSNLLLWCNHSDGYANADAKIKAEWARRCDAPFR